MKKSELLLNPYKEHLKKPYLHWAWTLEIDWVQYSADEYITMLEEENKELNEELDYVRSIKDSAESTIKTQDERIRFLEQCLDNKEKVNKSLREDNKWYEKEEDRLRGENKKLKNSIEYRKKKAEANQEKANQIDKIMNLPWVMVDWKIDWSKVAVYYCI